MTSSWFFLSTHYSKLQVFSSEGRGRKRTFTGDTDEYHDALRFDWSVLGEFLARSGLQCCLNRVGPYFVVLFPFPCISPVSDYRYRTCAIVAEQIGLTGGLSNFDPETLPASVSKGFLGSLPAAQQATSLSLTLCGIHPNISVAFLGNSILNVIRKQNKGDVI